MTTAGTTLQGRRAKLGSLHPLICISPPKVNLRLLSRGDRGGSPGNAVAFCGAPDSLGSVEQTHVGSSAQSCFLSNRNVIVTCGPSYEPIDEVRRITNSSTGELGVLLAQHLAQAGWEVLCCKGSGATFPGPEPPARLSWFQTNDDLRRLLQSFTRTHSVAAVFHSAALCDYCVKDVQDDRGRNIHTAKIASRTGSLHLVLAPATKVIAELRDLFPASLLVGWKYELAGTRADALAQANRQIAECRTNACVVNGRAFGPGFGFCQPTGELAELEDKPALVRFLVDWLAAQARA